MTLQQSAEEDAMRKYTLSIEFANLRELLSAMRAVQDECFAWSSVMGARTDGPQRASLVFDAEKSMPRVVQLIREAGLSPSFFGQRWVNGLPTLVAL
jgi:hypothetical protein